MSPTRGSSGYTCSEADRLYAYSVRGLAPHERADFEAHLANCVDCRLELESLRPIVGAFSEWPTDVLQPSASLWDRLAQRLPQRGTGAPSAAADPWVEPEWREVAPGISCKILATDAARRRVSMLVRLAPGVEYPPHTHAGVEELHLLDGELWIDARKLYPGDYNYAEPGTADARVWSETGCTCVLITSPDDTLR